MCLIRSNWPDVGSEVIFPRFWGFNTVWKSIMGIPFRWSKVPFPRYHLCVFHLNFFFFIRITLLFHVRTEWKSKVNDKDWRLTRELKLNTNIISQFDTNTFHNLIQICTFCESKVDTNIVSQISGIEPDSQSCLSPKK